MPRSRQVAAAAALAAFAALTTAARAEGFPRGHRDALGPNFEAAPQLREGIRDRPPHRIYLGIHWSFDKTEGIAQGRRVARYVFRNAFEPVQHRG